MRASGGRFWALVVIAASAIGVGSVLLVGGAGASGVQKAAPPAVPLPPAARAPANSPAAVMRYWTPARMAAAKPALPAVRGTAGPAQAVNAGDTATGAPGVAGGTYPPSNPGAVADVNRNLMSTSVPPPDGGYPGPNDTFNYPPASLRGFPASTVGKLFFTEPGGNFVCSGAVTYGGHTGDMVWTAGHCVGAQGGQSYYTNFEFCPSYTNGPNPQVGCWPYASAQQTGGWYFSGQYSADYAYLFLSKFGTVQSRHVVAITGGLGFAWNQGRDQHWVDLGYPSGSPYNGNYLVETAGEHRYDVTNPDSCGANCTADNSMGSKQTPGFSGGPWILSFGVKNANDPILHGNWINSDNSYYFTGGSNGNEYGAEIQGPYFDTNACSFWETGSGSTTTC